MTFSITIDPADPHGSDHSLSDEEDSSVVQVSVPSDGSHEYQDYDEWAHLSFPDELKPSDSASRPRTSHRNRSLHGSRSASGRRHPSRRHMLSERESLGQRARRHHSPESPSSADLEDYGGHYARTTHDRRWPPAPPAPGGGYAQSASSGPSYNAYPTGHGPYPHPNGPLPSDQLIRFGHPNPGASPYGSAPYPYGPQPPAAGNPMYPFYAQDHGHPRHPRPPSRSRIDSHNPPLHAMGSHGAPSPYGGSTYPHEMMPYGPSAYYNYRDPYSMVQGMMPQSYFPAYPQIPSPTQRDAKSSPAGPPADAAKDEAIARLEKLILDERTERETKEAARQAAIEREAAEKAAREQQLAHDKKIAEDAAALARADAEKKAAEDAAKAKEDAEKAAAAAAAKAAATKAEAPKKPPAEKKKPIKFKDAVGRKFSFPFELCSTWQGMEDLIKQAFLHIEVIGPHVAEGHYDLVGPNGDIILPQVWETVVEPDWAITMHMWPIPEKPKDADPPSAAEGSAGPAKSDAATEQKKKADAGNKRPKGKTGTPMPVGGFAGWMMGNRPPPKTNKAPKADKKPEQAAQ